jgi:two-component system CheB/CheR fusion protein
MAETTSNKKFESLLEYLRATRGFDFTGYKRPSLTRRVSKRMQAAGIADFGDYVDDLEVHPEEFAQLFNTILINVTGFFRDAAAWEYLAKEVLPLVVKGRKKRRSDSGVDGRLRVG